MTTTKNRTDAEEVRDSPPTPIIIGIAGGTASGKSALADAIYRELGEDENVVYIHHEQYYKTVVVEKQPQEDHHPHECCRESKTKPLNFDHPDSLDTDLLIEHLQGLKKGMTVEVPHYDILQHKRIAWDKEFMQPKAFILLEGILLFSDPRLVNLIDVKVFVDVDADVRLFRRLDRDVNERGQTTMNVFKQYAETVGPMHEKFVEPSKRHADIIVQKGDNPMVVSMIINYLRVVSAK